MFRLRLRASIVGIFGFFPSLILARSDLVRLTFSACALIGLCLIGRVAWRALFAQKHRSYLFARLFSPRYLVPAMALPIVGAWLISTWGGVGVIASIALNIAVAQRYAQRFARQDVFPAVLLPATLGGLYCAIEWMALRGREWRFGGKLLYAEQSTLQRVVLVERGDSIDLYIDGELQFRSVDERLYHEGLLATVISADEAASSTRRLHVMVMGGGDGLAARDLLTCARVERVTIVDWDRAVTRLFRSEPALVALNKGALADPRVEIIHRDIRDVLAARAQSFDVVIGDLTDPNPSNIPASPLHSTAFCQSIRQGLAPQGYFVTHATSLDGTAADQAAREALEAASFITTTYQREVPSFGRVTYLLARCE